MTSLGDRRRPGSLPMPERIVTTARSRLTDQTEVGSPTFQIQSSHVRGVQIQKSPRDTGLPDPRAVTHAPCQDAVGPVKSDTTGSQSRRSTCAESAQETQGSIHNQFSIHNSDHSLSVGYQHSRKYNFRFGGCWWNWLEAAIVAECSRLATSHYDPTADSSDGGRQ